MPLQLGEKIKEFINNSNEDERENGSFSNERIEEFILLIKNNYNGQNNGEIDARYYSDSLSQIDLTLKEKYFLDDIINIVLKKISEQNKIIKSSTENRDYLISRIEGLGKNILTDNKYKENQTKGIISYFYDEGKYLKKCGDSSNHNQVLSGALLPLKMTHSVDLQDSNYEGNRIFKNISNEGFTIDFEKIKNEKSAESITQALDKLFGNYNYSESYLYLITGFISLLQSQEYGLKNEDIKLGLQNFLKNRFPIFLQEPKQLNKDNNNILDNPDYWRIRNLLQLFTLGTKVEKQTGKEKLIVGTFSPGGSYGPIYLGQLYKQFQEEKNTGKKILPDIYIGSSAGTLYPTLFLLWKNALEINPKGLKDIIPNGVEVDSLNSLLSMIPENIDSSDSMFMNGEKLINLFFEKFKNLVQIISPNKNLDFENLSFEDLNLPLIAVSSFEYKKDRFVPGLFTNNDNIKKSIITSSNPKSKILGFDINVLSSDNEIYGKKWYDGFHSLNNPIEMGYLLNYSKINKYESFYTRKKVVIYGLQSNPDSKIEEFNPLNEVELDVSTQGDSFDKNNAIFYSIIGKVGELEIYNLYDLLIEIKNSDLAEDKKKYFRDKLVDFFLIKKTDNLFFGSNQKLFKEKAFKITKLIEENLLTEKETEKYLNKLFLSKNLNTTTFLELISETNRSIKLHMQVNNKSKKIEKHGDKKFPSYLTNAFKDSLDGDIKKSHILLKDFNSHQIFFYNQLNNIILNYKEKEVVKNYLLNLKDLFTKSIELNLFSKEEIKPLKDTVTEIDKILLNK